MALKKQDIKDMVHQMISVTLQGFSESFDETKMSEEEKRYAFNLIKKYEKLFEEKIVDENFKKLMDVNDLADYAAKKSGV